MRRFALSLLAAVFVVPALAAPVPAYADGIIVPEPPICDPGPCPPVPLSQLAIEYHRVHVTVENQVAVTHVDQVFRNDNDWTVEGTYLFPLPPDSAVTGFTLWMDGEPVEGQVLTADEARHTYEDIVRSLRDPALLEYVDRGAVQASIFPIEPGATSRVELEYTQVLPAESGLIHYRYPLNTERFSTEPLEDVSVTVEVTSREAVRAVYSPSHAISVDREGEFGFTASYEESGVLPNTDFDLYYSVAESDIGLNLLTFRDPESDDPDGFFLLLAAPSVEVDPDDRIARDVILVLDQSGSMEGEKFRQAQAALRYVLDHLNPEDRFNVIAFSSGLQSFADDLRPASEAAEARRWVDGLSAVGSTDINRALLEAAAQARRERPTILIFLTDGLPTEGETDSQDILRNVAEAAPESLRLFAFGVGYDVDTVLLDSLAQDHHGSTSYVTPSQSIDEAVSGFYARVSAPVLTDLEIDFDDSGVFDLYPSELPDLFAGSQLVVVGRYREPGGGTLRLSGSVEGATRTFIYPDQSFRASGGPEFLPRLWATRKIGALLNEIHLNGPQEEVIDQIVRLSVRYGIVTPYTSYLVTEPEALGAGDLEGIVAEEYQRMLAAPTQVSGQDAVEQSAAASGLGGAEVVVGPPSEAADIVRVAGSRAFRQIDGVWIDTAFDPNSMTTLKVAFASEDYFALAAARPDVAAAFALGERVIVVSDGTAYEVVGSDQPSDPIPLPAGLAPAPDEPAVSSTEIDRREVTPPASTSGGLPCPGSALAFGLAAIPFTRRRRRG